MIFSRSEISSLGSASKAITAHHNHFHDHFPLSLPPPPGFSGKPRSPSIQISLRCPQSVSLSTDLEGSFLAVRLFPHGDPHKRRQVGNNTRHHKSITNLSLSGHPFSASFSVNSSRCVCLSRYISLGLFPLSPSASLSLSLLSLPPSLSLSLCLYPFLSISISVCLSASSVSWFRMY